MKLESARRIAQHAHAGYVGWHEVGRELDPGEGEAERAGKRADEQRLGRARDALDQQVTAGEERDERIFDRRPLSNDASGNGLTHSREKFCPLLERRRRRGCVLIRCNRHLR